MPFVSDWNAYAPAPVRVRKPVDAKPVMLSRHAPLAAAAREPRAERNHDGQAEHVHVADPRKLRDRRVQLALQRRIRGVQHEHVREVDREAEQVDGGDSGTVWHGGGNITKRRSVEAGTRIGKRPDATSPVAIF